MPVHDWTIADDGTFHAFHTAWIAQLQGVLNETLLPKDYYALAEQRMGHGIADVLTLHSGGNDNLSAPDQGIAVAQMPPKARRRQTIENVYRTMQRTIAIRHVSGDRLIALIEIVSPANKDRAVHVGDFAAKAVNSILHGIHLMMVDIIPPGRFDRHGMHEAIVQRIEDSEQPYDLPTTEPLTIGSYSAGEPQIFLEHLNFGDHLPDTPLFLQPDRYVVVPLESTYANAFRGFPALWRQRLDAAIK